MEMLRSSIIGREFVNYRKSTMKTDRIRFSNKVRSQGLGNVPIVIDSVDSSLGQMLSSKEGRERNYGIELVMHMDKTISDVLKEVKIIVLQKDMEEMFVDSTLIIGLEDGSIPELTTDLGTIYKKHRNNDDKILYLLLTKEKSTYGYIMSIIRYLTRNVIDVWKKFKNVKT